MQNWQVSPPSSARRLVLASPMIACIFEDFSNFVLNLATNHRMRIVTSWRHTYPGALPLSLIA